MSYLPLSMESGMSTIYSHGLYKVSVKNSEVITDAGRKSGGYNGWNTNNQDEHAGLNNE